VNWSCPACGREFSHKRGHVCAPALGEDDYFASRPSYEREVYRAVRDHLESVGPVIVEFVGVGIFFKTRRNVVELRPMKKWVNVGFGLYRYFEDPRISRTTRTRGPSTYYGVRATSAADIDEQLRAWLTEAYLDSGV
jgi:hypothetical protein